MFKKIILVFLLSVIIIIFASCTNSNIENEHSERLIMSDRPSSEEGNYGTGIENVTDWETVIEYNGVPITLEFLLHNLNDTADYGIILFVNGIRVMYTTNEHNQFDFMHIFQLEAEEMERTIMVTFSPNSASVGNTVTVNIATILNPNYIPVSLDLPKNLMHHSFLSIAPYNVQINTSDNQKVLVSNIINMEEPLPQEMEDSFIRDSNDNTDSESSGVINELDNISQFMLFQESLDTIETCYTVQEDVDLKLILSWFGKSGNYRVSLYINNEIVPVFDGNEYLDVEVDRKMIRTRYITIPADIIKNLNEFNHIYFIAVPLGQEEVVSLIKNKTKILYVQSN